MTNDKAIFVTGATGKQGGAVARSLGQDGFQVLALTRNTNSKSALALKRPNIQLVHGDLNKPDTYRKYLKDVSGVFSVQVFQDGIEKEIKQGITLATIAKESGVKHFLYSSVAGADLSTGVPHFDSKFKIENHIKQIDLPFTIIRPTSFYENFFIPQVRKGILKGKLPLAIKRGTVSQFISTEDIGKIAARIFQNRNLFINKTITLASEQLTSVEVTEIFSKALDRKVEYENIPGIIVRLFIGRDLYKMFKWLDEKSSFSKEVVDSTLKEFPGLVNLRKWIELHLKEFQN